MKLARTLCFLIFISIMFSITSYAQEPGSLPYNGYNYNAWNRSVPSPIGYEPVAHYTGTSIGVGEFANPSDLFVTKNGDIYISDTDNNRIIVMDKNFHLISIIDHINGSSEAIQLKAPCGLFVDEQGNIYIAQALRQRVVKIDKNCNYITQYTKPVSDLISDSIQFAPLKVIVNSMGTVFVLVDGLYLGAIMYNQSGKFFGFYGSNKVEITLSLLADYMWKKILTQTQINKMSMYVPIQFSNFDIDSQNFIYTCTQTSQSTSNQITKLNALGYNVLRAQTKNISSSTYEYGDLEKGWFMGQSIQTKFVDVCINKDGFIFGLDSTRGRIFEYDQESKLLQIFGESGNQLGAFKTPVAIGDLGENILVLDSTKGNITVFAPTEFGSLVNQGVLLYNQGDYENAKSIWQNVLSYDVNYVLAYGGIGKALFQAGKYNEALEYLKYGFDRQSYSEAYKEYRTVLIRNYFPYVATVLSALIIFLFIFIKLKKKIVNWQHLISFT